MTTSGIIRLRRKSIGDARDDYTWRKDAELARLDAAEPLETGYAQFLAEYTFDLYYPSSNRKEFAIEKDGKHIGNCVYYNIRPVEREAELGILIGDKDSWGKGYGAEAVNLLLKHIFSETVLNHVYLNTLDWNIRAQKCFKRCGFNECGRVMREGRDFVIMETARENWQEKQTLEGTLPVKVPIK